MSIGKRKQIRLEKWVTSKDSLGDNKEQVTDIYLSWAEVSQSAGQRSSLNGQAGLTNFYIFKVRFKFFDPTGNWRVIYDQRQFTISSIEKENQNRFYWIIKAEAA